MSDLPGPAVVPVTAANLGPVLEYLEGHLDTSIFLLSCLTTFGPEMGTDGRSGNYRARLRPRTSGSASACSMSRTSRRGMR